MGLHNDIATALAAKGAAITGVRGGSGKPLDVIPSSPYFVVGPPQGQLLAPGSWERLLLTYPARLYVARISSADRDQATVNDILDLFLTGWRTGITLGSLVTEAIIKSWDTDRWYSLNGEDWQAIDFVIGVEVERAATYTA